MPAGSDHCYLRRDRAAGVALVFVDRPPSFIDADVVLSDNAGGARAATAHLIAARPPADRLPRRPARIFTATERLRGYREALADQSLAYDQKVFEGRAKLSGQPVNDVKEAAMSIQSIKRLVDPRDIAALAVFLASDGAKSISGQMLSIDNDMQQAT